MADFFVSADRGSDSTGTGTATNPWKTIGKAIGAGKAVGATLSAPTDLHVEPGVYYEAVEVQVTPSAGAPLTIRGDCDGLAFAAGGYATPKTGDADWIGWTGAAGSPINSPTITIAKNWTAVERIRLTAGSHLQGSIAITGNDCAVRRCVVFGADGSGKRTAAVDVSTSTGARTEISQCAFVSNSDSDGLTISLAERSASYTADLKIVNCVFVGGLSCVSANRWSGQSNGTASAGSGVEIQQCTFLSARSQAVNALGFTTTALIVAIKGCVVLFCDGIVSASAVGQVAEDGNSCYGLRTPRVNTAAGANTRISVEPMLDFLGSAIVGGPIRPFVEPLESSPFNGAGGYGDPPAVDLFGRERSDPPAAGCLEWAPAASPPALTLPRCIAY